MSEGNVFIISWKRTDAGYRLWVKGRPKLAAEGTSFEEADERLTQVIGLATGDGENIHEFVPPAPLEESASLDRGRLWRLGVEPSADMRDPAGLFEGGLCESCLMPRGPRTGMPLAVSRIQSRMQASTVSLPRCSPGVGPVLSIFTEELLTLLTPAERGQFDWRPIASSKGEKRSFHELIHRTPPVQPIGVKGNPTYYGVCDTCGWKWIVSSYVKGRPLTFVSETDVGLPAPRLTAVGDFARLRLAASDTRWNELAGKPELKGIKGSIIGIVAEDAVERHPVFVPRPAEQRPASASESWFDRGTSRPSSRN